MVRRTPILKLRLPLRKNGIRKYRDTSTTQEHKCKNCGLRYTILTILHEEEHRRHPPLPKLRHKHPRDAEGLQQGRETEVPLHQLWTLLKKFKGVKADPEKICKGFKEYTLRGVSYQDLAGDVSLTGAGLWKVFQKLAKRTPDPLTVFHPRLSPILIVDEHKVKLNGVGGYYWRS